MAGTSSGQHPDEPDTPSRRTVLRGAAALGGVSVTGGLAGCSGRSGSRPAQRGSSAAAASSSALATTLPPETAAARSSAAAGQPALIAASRVPPGGGVVLADQKVVVTQPTAGQFKAFSAICTHQNCRVTEVSQGAIQCYCHGSRFSIEDGSVTNPPAQKALPPVAVTVRDGNIVRG